MTFWRSYFRVRVTDMTISHIRFNVEKSFTIQNVLSDWWDKTFGWINNLVTKGQIPKMTQHRYTTEILHTKSCLYFMISRNDLANYISYSIVLKKNLLWSILMTLNILHQDRVLKTIIEVEVVKKLKCPTDINQTAESKSS